jgi:hypothetical protein
VTTDNTNPETTGTPAAADPARFITRGKCDTGRPLCGKPARWTTAGWRCFEHRPRSR